MRRDTLHITLVFLGAVPETRLPVLVDAAGRVRGDAFEVVLDRIGWWPHNRIFWLGCDSMPSSHRRLHDDLVKELMLAGFANDARPYCPHLTLLRNARCAGLLPACPTVHWFAREFTLVESLLGATGARYRELARWPLRDESGTR